MRRSTRLAAAGTALAAVLTLAACDKPAPKVTIQTGATSTTVSPTSYAFDASHLREYSLSVPEITADTGRSVLIDVPRKLAKSGWTVTALSLASPQRILGESGDIEDRHTYRVASQQNNGNPFLVQVQQLRDGRVDGSKWSFLVKVDDGT